MKDPAVTHEGQVYERSAINEWFRSRRSQCPGAVYNSCREAHLHQYNGGIMNGTLVHGRMKDEG